MKFTVSEDVEIILNGERYLLEKGDQIEIDPKFINEGVKDPSGILRRAQEEMERIDRRIDQGRSPIPYTPPLESRDEEMIRRIIMELLREMPPNDIKVATVIDRYNDIVDPKNREAGHLLDKRMVDRMIKKTIDDCYRRMLFL